MLWRTPTVAHALLRAVSAIGFLYGPAYRGTRSTVPDARRQHSCAHTPVRYVPRRVRT